LVQAEDASNNLCWEINPYSDGLVYFSQAGFATMQAYTAAEWRLDVFTRPAGGASTVRSHAFTYNAGTWSHANGAGAVGDSAFTPLDHTYLGRISAANDLGGEIAVAAVWKRALSDGECELLPYQLDAWRASAPDALWVLNQTSTSDAVQDLSGGGANQTAISGTTVSSLEVPGFSYISNTVAFPVRFGGRGSRGLMLRANRSVFG
jgi:hypothetical protein